MVKNDRKYEGCEGCEGCGEPAWKGYIRPFGFALTLGVFFIIMFIDGNVGAFSIKEAYFSILETVLVTIVIAFYGSRGVEKTVQTMTSSNTKPPAPDTTIPK